MLPHAVGVGGVDFIELGKLGMGAVCHGGYLNTMRVSETEIALVLYARRR
jgi:hypothetical protein